jgi:hypothetical protein
MIIHQAKSNPQLLDDQIFSERIALLYGPAARCKPNLTELMGLAPLHPALDGTFHGYPSALDLIRVSAPKAMSTPRPSWRMRR